MEKFDSYFEHAKLISRFIEGKLSEEEFSKLQEWIDESEEHRKLWEKMTDPAYLEENLKYWEDENADSRWTALKTAMKHRSSLWSLRLRKTLRYAAVFLPLVVLASAGWYLLSYKKNKKQPLAYTTDLSAVHILPKGKVARLILGNGKIVKLKGGSPQDITEKDGTKVNNRKNTLHYQADKQNGKTNVVYNTLVTPRGGEYQIILADGTKVWLNAASSLRFPTRFKKKERKVYLSGEAYFEVAENEQQPFIVNTGRMDVTVLGTRFNVAAYADDKKQVATLADGAIKVHYSRNNKRTNSVLLQPGYEAVISGSGDKIGVNKANIKAALAWKNGLFIFNSETLGHIMRTLSRWYDTEIEYEDGVDTLLHFTGRIRKYENITGILKKLEMTGKIRFSIRGHEVKVAPYDKGVGKKNK